jgi:hypothetical protein
MSNKAEARDSFQPREFLQLQEQGWDAKGAGRLLFMRWLNGRQSLESRVSGRRSGELPAVRGAEVPATGAIPLKTLVPGLKEK